MSAPQDPNNPLELNFDDPIDDDLDIDHSLYLD